MLKRLAAAAFLPLSQTQWCKVRKLYSKCVSDKFFQCLANETGVSNISIEYRVKIRYFKTKYLDSSCLEDTFNLWSHRQAAQALAGWFVSATRGGRGASEMKGLSGCMQAEETPAFEIYPLQAMDPTRIRVLAWQLPAQKLHFRQNEALSFTSTKWQNCRRRAEEWPYASLIMTLTLSVFSDGNIFGFPFGNSRKSSRIP